MWPDPADAATRMRRRCTGGGRGLVVRGGLLARACPGADGRGDGAGQAGNAPVEFDIPSQPMAAALNAWAVQANTQVFVDPGPVAHLIAPAVKGTLTPRQALRALLAHSHSAGLAGRQRRIRHQTPADRRGRADRLLHRKAAAPEARPTPATVARAPLTARASEGPWLLGVLADYARDHGNATGGATAAVGGRIFHHRSRGSRAGHDGPAHLRV